MYACSTLYAHLRRVDVASVAGERDNPCCDRRWEEDRSSEPDNQRWKMHVKEDDRVVISWTSTLRRKHGSSTLSVTVTWPLSALV